MREAYLSQYPATTQRVYNSTLVEFDTLMEVPVEECEVSDAALYNYRIRDNAQATISRKLSTLSSYSNFLVKLKARTDNPFDIIRRPKIDPIRTINWLTDEEADRLLEAASGDPRAYALVLMGLHGLRISEIVGLNAEQYRNGALWQISGKGGRSRTVPLVGAAQRAIEALLAGRTHGPLFRGRRGRLSVRTAQYIITSISQKAGKRINSHALRHTFGTSAIRTGNSTLHVQRLMGHTNPATTERYVHLDDSDSRKVVESTLARLMDDNLIVIEGGKISPTSPNKEAPLYRQKEI